MTTNKLFRECLAEVSPETRAEFELSFAIADRIDYLLKKKGLSRRDLARLTSRHNFTIKTLANIALVLEEDIIAVI